MLAGFVLASGFNDDIDIMMEMHLCVEWDYGQSNILSLSLN